MSCVSSDRLGRKEYRPCSLSLESVGIRGENGKGSCRAHSSERRCDNSSDDDSKVRPKPDRSIRNEVRDTEAVAAEAAAPRKAKSDAAIKARSASRPTFDLPAAVRHAREQQSLPVAKLAELVGCTDDDIGSVEAGVGRAAILARVMDTLKVDLIGLKLGEQLHRRLQLTRDAKGWTVEKLALRTGLPHGAITDLERGQGTVRDLLIVLPVLSRAIGIRARHSRFKSADKDSRFTPPQIAAAIEAAFGKITLDPCAHPMSPVQAVHMINKSEGGDGLELTWSGEVVFVNPPYSGSSDWLRKVNCEWEGAKIRVLLCLINSKTDAAAFHQALRIGADVFFFEGRVKYIKPDGTAEPSSQPSMLLAFGTTPRQRKAFAAAFAGTWMAHSS